MTHEQPKYKPVVPLEEHLNDRTFSVVDEKYSCEVQLFGSIGMQMNIDYAIHHVEVAPGESVYTIRFPAKKATNPPLYMTHGFGGTSLFYYDLVPALREHSEVILFDLRGFGLSDKERIELEGTHAILEYFTLPIEKIRSFYQHSKIHLAGHSFGSYICMLYASANKHVVDKLITFSPIGITPKEEDYKNKVEGCSGCLHWLISQLGWKCELTYKSFLKYFACCCQKWTLKKVFAKEGNSEQRINAFSKIILRMLHEPLCGEKLFFRIFLPRVLPVYNLEEHYRDNPPHCQTKIIYGDDDWVDNLGAKRLTLRYADKVSYHELQGTDHQIFFCGRQGIRQQILAMLLD